MQVNRAPHLPVLMRLPACALFVAVLFVTVLFVTVLIAGVAHAQEDVNPLAPGALVQDELTSRQGDAWSVRLCADDVVTITMQSDAVTPFIELLDADEILLDDSLADDDTAEIDGVVIETTGNYLVLAAGESRTARGAYTLRAELDRPAIVEPLDGLIAPGEVTTATLRPRRVAAWSFHACAGDRVTATVRSGEFDAFAELFPAGDEELLAEDDNSGGNADAEIAEFELPASGAYILLVSGAGRNDAGEYTLALTVSSDEETRATGDATSHADATITKSVAIPRRTTTPTRTPTPSVPSCTVLVDALNVRSGPGTVFAPPIGSLRAGDVVEALARDQLGTWIEVRTFDGRLQGWVSGTTQFVDCSLSIARLPLGRIPSTPTPTRTPTATPSATPTQAVAQGPRPPTEIGIGGGGGGGLAGEIRADTALVRDPNGRPTFRDAMYLRMLVWDPDRGNDDGDGIEYVEFFIQEQFGDFRDVYARRENSPAFCSFGGGEPLCNELRLRDGARWPESNIPIFNEDYTATIVAHPRNSNNTPSWSVDFTVNSPNLRRFDDSGNNDSGNNDSGNNNGGNNNGGGNQSGEIVANIAQTGPGSQSTYISGALVFQVIAYDPARGNDDGDGIDHVFHEIFGPGGNRVYARQENNAHYCAFSGGEPDCDVFRFTVGDSRWEETDNRVEAGPHVLRATVRADDGRTTVVATTVLLE